MIVAYETATDAPRDLRSLNDAEVGEVLVGWGHKSYRTRQLLDWVYKKRVCTFDEMTDLSQELRAQLPEAFRLQSLECAREQVSSDGTVKFLWRLADGEFITDRRLQKNAPRHQPGDRWLPSPETPLNPDEYPA